MEEMIEPKNGIETFKNYWNGHGKLSVAYWGYGVVGTLILYFICMLGSLIFIPLAYEEGKNLIETTIFQNYLALIYLILLLYQFLVWTLVWQNSQNCRNILWGYIAKFIVISGALSLAYQLLQKI